MEDVVLRLQELLIPSIANVAVLSVGVGIELVRVDAQCAAGGAACPGCGTWSPRVHSSCLRFPADASERRTKRRTRQAHVTPAGDRWAALAPGRRRMDPPAPGNRHLGRAASAQGIRTRYPQLDVLTRHVRSFATMLTGRQGQRLPDRLDAVQQDDLPSLHSLATGIDRDRDAVIAGLTLPWNSDVVEGHVIRIKVIQRQMFGRAGFALIRKRVLLSS
ncbi:hypothetical protein [Streptomyces sp. NPDC007856]|uniref:hypothetical protein n=1 Tax=Streptomyces sp. NPDC007856 TaxID=3364781 RepID=UPI00369D6BCF